MLFIIYIYIFSISTAAKAMFNHKVNEVTPQNYVATELHQRKCAIYFHEVNDMLLSILAC